MVFSWHILVEHCLFMSRGLDLGTISFLESSSETYLTLLNIFDTSNMSSMELKLTKSKYLSFWIHPSCMGGPPSINFEDLFCPPPPRLVGIQFLSHSVLFFTYQYDGTQFKWGH